MAAANKSSPQKVNGVLRAALRRYGIDKDLARYQFVTHWNEIVGEDIAKRSKPECFRNGALIVRVSDSAWAQELSFRKDVILQRLRRFINDDEVVNDVMFYVDGAA